MNFRKFVNKGNFTVTNHNNCPQGNHNQQSQRHECRYSGCDAIFQSKRGLEIHVKEVHTKKKRARKQDTKAAAKKPTVSPTKDSKEPRVKCTHCEKDFASKRSMHAHRSKFHKDEEGASYNGRFLRAAKTSRHGRILAKLKND